MNGRPPVRRLALKVLRRVAALIGFVLCTIAHAVAAPIANPVATFSGLDKITARITNFDVYINETVQFGSLQITPRVCYTRPDNETQRTSVFVEVDQVSLKGTTERIFTGWMFADSPALNAVDNAVYDFWLVDCKQRSDVPPPTAANAAPVQKPPPQASAGTTAAAGATPKAAGDSAIGALINPKPTAQTSPDGQ
jgi:hypothetical protein